MFSVPVAPGEGRQHGDAQCEKFSLPRRAVLHVLQVDQHIGAGGAEQFAQRLRVPVVHPERHRRLAACLTAVDQLIDQLQLTVHQCAAVNGEGHARCVCGPAISSPGEVIREVLEGFWRSRVVDAGMGEFRRGGNRIGGGAVMPGTQVGEQVTQVALAAVAVIADQALGDRCRQVAEGRGAAADTYPGRVGSFESVAEILLHPREVGGARRIQDQQIRIVVRDPIGGRCDAHTIQRDVRLGCPRRKPVEFALQHELGRQHPYLDGVLSCGIGRRRVVPEQRQQHQEAPLAHVRTSGSRRCGRCGLARRR